jgi:hypothetical protein
LLQLLRGQLVDRAVDEAELDSALALAREQRVLPWVTDILLRGKISIPSAARKRLQGLQREAALDGFYWSSELKSILSGFEAHDLAVVLLKGPFLAERLYGGVALRAGRDLDLLVAKADLPRAEAVLTAMGFAPGFPDDYHRPWYRWTTTVELHHDVENPLAFNFHVEGALRRAQSAVFQGQRCWHFAPEDELLFLCLHGVRHRFEHLSLILDLQLAFEKLPALTEHWQPRSETRGLDNLLTLGLAMARHLQPELSVNLELRTSAPQTRHLENLADRLWSRLLSSPSERLDWNSLHSFYLEIEAPGRDRMYRRLRHLRILVGRTIEPDYRFAANFGLGRSWQVRLLRPVRLLCGLVQR